MTIGVKYIAYGNASGYGLAGVAYVRALRSAGVPVWWQPWFLGPRPYRWRPEDGLERLALGPAAKGDAALVDLPALLAATGQPIDYDTVVVHTVPDYWPRFVEPGRRTLGYTVWETDALPDHWPELLRAVDTFAGTFAAGERVALLVKTSATVSNAASAQPGAVTEARVREITRAAEERAGRAAAPIVVLAADYKHAATPRGVRTLLEWLDADVAGVFSLHLWAHLWWDAWRTDFTSLHAGSIDEDYVRTRKTTYATLARRFLEGSG